MAEISIGKRRSSSEATGAASMIDLFLPAPAASTNDKSVSRARELASGLKQRLRSSQLPAPVVEAEFLSEQSRNPQRSLLERIRIVGLFASVLDHFFAEQAPNLAISQKEEIAGFLNPLLDQTCIELNGSILPELNDKMGIEVLRPHELDGSQRTHLRSFFRRQLYPMLTPLAVDPGHPFPFISSHSINLLVHLSSTDFGAGPLSYARIKVPRLMSRFVEVPAHAEKRLYIWSEDAVAAFLDELFPGMQIEDVFLFRVLRASGEGHKGDDLKVQSKGLRHRQLSFPVARLEVEASMPDSVLEWLASHLPVPIQLCFRSAGPLALIQLVDLANLAQE